MRPCGRPAVLPLAVSAALAGCGGGISIGFGDFDDGPPSVSLAASARVARAGETIRLVAAASDESGIAQVAFFRLEPDASATLLGRDDAAPFELPTALPHGASGSARYFARATDGTGDQADSAVVVVTVVP